MEEGKTKDNQKGDFLLRKSTEENETIHLSQDVNGWIPLFVESLSTRSYCLCASK